MHKDTHRSPKIVTYMVDENEEDEEKQEKKREKMGNDMMSFTKVWTTVITSLCYSYLLSSRITKGKMRLLSLVPVILIFVFLPMSFSSVNLQLTTGLFISWLANFKLLLFAFDQDLLSTGPSLSLLEFIVTTSLPIKIKPPRKTKNKKPAPTNGLRPSRYIFTYHPLLWLLLTILYTYKEYMHMYISRAVYRFRMLLGTEYIFMLSAFMAQWLLGKELEPQFNNHYLSTSLQNFWGRRWNLTVSSLLRSSIYEPVRSFLTPLLGRRWALHPAILVTFMISGLMHEMDIYYVRREWPTWEVLWFFIMHGICVAAEIEVKKKALNAKWRLQPRISIVLTIGFVLVSDSWLLYKPLIESGADVREMEEYVALFKWARQALQLISRQVFT